MDTPLSHGTRLELAHAPRARDQSATGRQQPRILDEVIATTGCHEKSAIRVVKAELACKQRQTRARASLYDEAVRAALIVLGEASDRGCGTRLKALLPLLVPAVRRHITLTSTVMTDGRGPSNQAGAGNKAREAAGNNFM